VTHFVSYTRVSTHAQGQNGLGMQAQRDAVASYVKSVGGTIIREFAEVESGAKSDRPQLRAALNLCKAKRATLVIAKLDRLARNVRFISDIMESGIEFVAADMPSANRLTIHIIAAIAEHERAMIGDRTKAGLRAAKARGIKLGNPNWQLAQNLATLEAERRAHEFAVKMQPILVAIDPEQRLSPNELADALNGLGYRPRRAATWSKQSAANLLKRLRPEQSL